LPPSFDGFVFILRLLGTSQILGRRLPFRRLITRTQITQFVASFLLAAPMVVTHVRSRSCAGIPALAVSAFCNASYLALFLRFYRNAYRGGRTATSGKWD